MMHLYLIGYRGSGKSTVGKLLASQLTWPLVDTDCLVEEAAGKSIAAIFEQDGEPVFRDLEQQVVAQVAAGPQSIVSLGGGAILRLENQQTILKTGKCVWLTGSPDIHHARIQADAASQENRPSLTDRSGYDEVREVMRVREPVYRKLAQLELNTDHQSPDALTKAILPWVESWANS
jgi:shikimate kinase